MKGKGFEVIVKDLEGRVVIDRSVNNINDGHGWARNYAEGEFNAGREATFYIDGRPKVTYHGRERRKN
ncbi:MAG: hypothetical protein AABW87_02920 [Nanoarchaeota archaeon]